ncbi:MAG: replication-associated recombination protein A [Deltaproteobacteria bacterium]|nr:replication-associated recombination protein A [Deltaproteobacteria bacterium]
MDLFQRQAQRERRGQPLAQRVRPNRLEELFGQQHLVGPGRLLARVIADDRIPSMILWGPPGSGKTTLAQIIARSTGAIFVDLPAVGSGVRELRAAVEEAARQRDQMGRRTVLFIDEIHRFNKAQQDALLPHVEQGTVILVGATTENPSFEVIPALLSRSRVLRLEPLAEDDLVGILGRAVAEDAELRRQQAVVPDELLRGIAQAAGGDARRALTVLEVALSLVGPGETLTPELVQQALGSQTLLYDQAAEEHFNVASAFIKSLRGSDPDAAVYWMARMLEAGEDPIFVVRRMVIFAAEDIGNADPQALVLATAALSAVQLVGLPEGVLPLTQAATYLACAPKSNSALVAYDRARADVRQHGALPVPMHLRNAPTRLMEEQGYGAGYRYAHDHPGHFVAQEHLPAPLAGRRYYEPSAEGLESELGRRLERWRETAGRNGPERSG